MSNISNRILDIILAKGISYGELAELTKIPKSALQRYATGQTEKIPIDRLESIAKAIGTTTAYLMGWDDAKAPAEPGKRSISDDDIKFALFRGREDITDAMYQEVLGFADYVMRREEEKKKKE